MNKTSVLYLAKITAVLFFCVGASDCFSAELVGDGDDGNRSSFVHVINLLDENGLVIRPDDKNPLPFSTRTTCGKCHDYEKISGGRHFNFSNTSSPAGRPGEPFMLVDPATRTQIPISGRSWPGTFRPEELDISPWLFTKLFATHNPGGNYGQIEAGENDPEAMTRQQISGKYEINCLACHNADPRQNQNDAALQAVRQNYKWIPLQSSCLGVVEGAASVLSDIFDPQTDQGLAISYDKSRFNSKNEVFLDIALKPPAQRCYFCHSTKQLSDGDYGRWTSDQDVHIAAGLTCTDCHRNGLDHDIVCGDENEQSPAIKPQAAQTQSQLQVKRETLTCRGCHLGDDNWASPLQGRLGAPKPLHRGIPTVHFEKLSCTACHSGTWPVGGPQSVQTARIHKLGLHGLHSQNRKTPHIYSPVFIRDSAGKISPGKIIWPAYWGKIDGDKIVPIAPHRVAGIAAEPLGVNLKSVQLADDWRALTREQISDTLMLLNQSEEISGGSVYICGGRLYRLDGKGVLESVEDAAATPYAWPVAHDVRPAQQSLGIRGCGDCHTTDSAVLFGRVPTDSPVEADKTDITMTNFEKLNYPTAYAFAFSFVFRPWLKVAVIASCAIVAAVLLLYGLKALACVVRAAGWYKHDQTIDRQIDKCSD